MRISRSYNWHQMWTIKSIESRVPHLIRQSSWSVFWHLQKYRLRPIPFRKYQKELKFILQSMLWITSNLIKKGTWGCVWIELTSTSNQHSPTYTTDKTHSIRIYPLLFGPQFHCSKSQSECFDIRHWIVMYTRCTNLNLTNPDAVFHQ